MKKRVFLLAVMLVLLTPAVAVASTVYPESGGMSTKSSKYYCKSFTFNPQNIYGGDVFVYKFRPVWRINTSNSITSTDDASTFTKSNILSQWKLVDSASTWTNHKSGSKYVEAYYGEAISAAWGINISGECSAKTSGESITLKASANATVGQAVTRKYKATVSTGRSWTSCNYSYKFYN